MNILYHTFPGAASLIWESEMCCASCVHDWV